ncbi:protein-tyrosine-phosphatase [Roseiconus lacunae]|uniref:arsenate-mycothiol transferase ArsC n=1 Tax=Roseiconus lacunae TaxID=2605694 RepID=UPI003090C6AF|nr:protein-tyrosine-phosphatase [Stieleria sp. HD01]
MTFDSLSTRSKVQCFEPIIRWLRDRDIEQGLIPASRRAELSQLADYVRQSLDRSGTAKLTFVCTHNSRRSHLSQIWAKVAADACGLEGVETYSGGTEATAMNLRVVASLRRSGLLVETDEAEAENPVHRIRYSEQAEPMDCFSKVYSDPPNPSTDYAAIMTCSSADDACPIVPGCDLRLPIRYEDPKVADDSQREAEVYDDRSKQIGREMLAVMMAVR